MLRTLTRKVLLGVMLFLMLLALVAGGTYASLVSNYEIINHLSDHTLPFVRASDGLKLALARAIAETESFARTRRAEDRDEARAHLVDAQSQLVMLGEYVLDEDFDAASDDEKSALLSRWQVAMSRTDEYLATAVQAPQVQASESIERIEAFEAEFAQLERDTDALIEQEVTAATAAVARRNQTSFTAMPITFSVLGVGAVLIVWLLRRVVIRPIQQLSLIAQRVAGGETMLEVPITTDDEIGDLQRSFGQMLGGLREQHVALEARNASLQQSLAAQQRLAATVQQLAVPILPLTEDLVVLPLVGHIDEARAEAILRTLLNAVAERQARTVVLDITGVTLADPQVIRLLLQAVQATELLGARVRLAGVSAQMAQEIVAQGVDLGSLRTYRDVGAALSAELLALRAA